jgi:hypothetical protein
MKDRKYIDDILARQAYTGQDMPKKDPFDQGIMRAIKSSKESLAMDEEQEDRALRNSMISFGDAIGQMPRAKGFLANLAQAGRALSPALKTHDAYEDQARDINRRELGQAQKFRAAEDARAAQLEQSAYAREMADRQRDFQERQLAEQKDYHRQSLESARIKAENKTSTTKGGIPTHSNVDAAGLVDGKYVPFLKDKDRDPYSKKLMGANIVRSHLMDAQKIVDDFDKTYGDSMLNAPIIGSPLGKSRNIIGHFARNEAMKKEGTDRALLDQSIGTLATKFEKELKGGILTGDIIKRFQSMGIVPVAGDSPALIKSKLVQMLKAADEEREIAEKSLLGNYHYSPTDTSKLAEHAMGDMNALTDNVRTAPKNKSISMRDPETGEEYLIPMSKMQESLDDGLMIVE